MLARWSKSRPRNTEASPESGVMGRDPLLRGPALDRRLAGDDRRDALAEPEEDVAAAGEERPFADEDPRVDRQWTHLLPEALAPGRSTEKEILEEGGEDADVGFADDSIVVSRHFHNLETGQERRLPTEARPDVRVDAVHLTGPEERDPARVGAGHVAARDLEEVPGEVRVAQVVRQRPAAAQVVAQAQLLRQGGQNAGPPGARVRRGRYATPSAARPSRWSRRPVRRRLGRGVEGVEEHDIADRALRAAVSLRAISRATTPPPE